MKFTERFNDALKASSLRQNEIAKLLNVHPSFITQMKKGTNFPNLPMLFNICKVLDVSSDYLIGLSDNF